MTPELTALTLAALLQVVQFCWCLFLQILNWASAKPPRPATAHGLEAASRPTVGKNCASLPRHEQSLRRADTFRYRLYCDYFSDQSDLFTSACAFTYLGARVLYIPAYYFGWRPWRSLIWFAGFITIR